MLAAGVIVYLGGLLGQLIGNYKIWQMNGGELGSREGPVLPSLSVWACVKAAFWYPYGLYGMLLCLAAILGYLLYTWFTGDSADMDDERQFAYASSGTYGTSGWMDKKEMKEVLDLVPDLRKHSGVVLGTLDGKAVCVPQNTPLNANIAVYGASGSMKTRAYCMNRILQGVARGESLIISDPKSELYEKSSEYLREKGYTVRIFNLVSPANSDSWNCLAEIGGQELLAQMFVDVIIKNTSSNGRGDHFWDSAEMNLLKALVLYVSMVYKKPYRNIGQVYNLLTIRTEDELNNMFDNLKANHPAKAPYNLFRQASDTVRSGVIIGLGSRLQVFQSQMIQRITSYDEIDLVLPGKQPCAYFLVTSDQDSTFDFLASLFLSFAFIKLVRYADRSCKDGRLPVPVHVLGEELTACGTISELSRRISVIRSRNISLSCVFQNLAGLQNRYPQNQWQEILGNCDIQLFLGCTDPLTAEFVSSRSGIASVAVSSRSKMMSSMQVSDYTPQYRETHSVGKRPVLTPDEVLRLPIDQALVIIRGKKLLKVHKMDYSKHPEFSKLHSCKASAYVPAWRAKHGVKTIPAPPPVPEDAAPPKGEQKAASSQADGQLSLSDISEVDRSSILS